MTDTYAPINDTTSSLDRQHELPPIDAAEVRLDLLRGDVAVHLSKLDLLLHATAIYLEGNFDNELFS